MSLKNSEMHLFAGLGSPLLTGVLLALLVVSERDGCSFASGCASHADDKPTNEIVIEASLAAYKPNVTQPQKDTPPPEPTEKPEGVSNDAKQKPPEKKKPDDKKPDDKKPSITDFHHATDSDPGPPKPATIGDLSGSINGDAATSKGDPYFGRLKADMSFAPPEIARGDSVPIEVTNSDAWRSLLATYLGSAE